MEIGAIIAISVGALVIPLALLIFYIVCTWRQTKAQEKIANETERGVDIQQEKAHQKGKAQSKSNSSLSDSFTKGGHQHADGNMSASKTQAVKSNNTTHTQSLNKSKDSSINMI